MDASLQKINILADQLKSLQPLKPEYQQKLDKKIRLEFNYNSNHIEGNTLTYGETELLLIFDKTTGNHELREYEEMKSHDVAFEMIKDWAADKDRPLNEMALKNLHEILLVRPFWKEAITVDGQPTRRLIKVGAYKEYPNSVRLQNGELFHYASPEETPIQMGELINWFKVEEEKGELHPVALAALLHYKFVRIHPFDDGNGRISRLLMNYVLLKHDLPPVIIKSSDKKTYLFALNQADAGDLNAFVEYVAEQLIWSLKISISAAKGESLDEQGDLQKEILILSKKFSVKKAISKHPSIIYQIFSWFKKNLWTNVLQSISQFKPLYAESKEFNYVNNFPEQFPQKNIFEVPFLKSTEPEKVKIFGHDIYEEEINTLKWELKVYGIKGAKGKTSFGLLAKIDFRIDMYIITLSVDQIFILKNEYQYGEYMLDSDLESFQDLLSKKILSIIKEITE